MTELDQIWSQMLAHAAVNAVDSGNHEVAEYLRLKAANDAIRAIGVGWLIDTILELAGNAVRQQAAITMEREEPHNFARGNSNMVGSLLRVRHGVRCLTIEAGWTRTPRDGIMAGGALAFARISHFGMPKLSTELRLVHVQTLPRWLDETGAVIDTRELSRHIDRLIDK